MDRILSSPLFKNSKRYPNLLRFVAERSLNGHTEHLKERTLGVEVFGRSPDYDTNLDPVVRTTAVEIRKRIAQYYHEPGHETEIRIDFPSGSYLPEFRMPPKPAVVVVPATPHRRPMVLIGLAAIVAILVAAAVIKPWTPPPAIDRFWDPILVSSEPVLLYIGGQFPGASVDSAVTLGDLHRAEGVAFADATVLANVAAFLTSKGKSYHLRLQPSRKLEELKDGPAVLIGGFNNSWTIRLNQQMRFSLERNPEINFSWIQDREHPGTSKWSHSLNTPYSSLPEDYAIISRVWDPTTGKAVVSVGGIGKFGTAAAGELLTNRSYMEQILAQAPRDWNRKNIQAVVATNIVGQSSGPPRVIATHFW